MRFALYRLGDDGNCIQTDEEFLMVIKENQIADIPVNGDKESKGYITPIIDVKVGVSVDFDLQANNGKEKDIYWVEVNEEGDTNGTLYKTSLGGGEKIDFFADETNNGIVGSPYCIAFDWVGNTCCSFTEKLSKKNVLPFCLMFPTHYKKTGTICCSFTEK